MIPCSLASKILVLLSTKKKNIYCDWFPLVGCLWPIWLYSISLGTSTNSRSTIDSLTRALRRTSTTFLNELVSAVYDNSARELFRFSSIQLLELLRLWCDNDHLFPTHCLCSLETLLLIPLDLSRSCQTCIIFLLFLSCDSTTQGISTHRRCRRLVVAHSFNKNNNNHKARNGIFY